MATNLDNDDINNSSFKFSGIIITIVDLYLCPERRYDYNYVVILEVIKYLQLTNQAALFYIAVF